MILEPDDWSHISDNGQKLVLGLLHKNPNKRLGVDDILKHTWLYASKSVNHKVRKSFMQTMAKRRIRKMSMGVFETNSKRMNYLYRNHMNRQESGASDDNSVKSDNSGSSLNSVTPLMMERTSSNASITSQSSAYSDYTNQSGSSYGRDSGAGRNSISYSNDWMRRYSRTDDDLFELRLPSMSYTPRGSIVDMGDDYMDEDEMYAQYQNNNAYPPHNNHRHSTSFHKRKYSQ